MELDPIKVLLVEDSTLVLERLIEMFVEIECVELIGQVADAAAAIQAAEQLLPDVIVLDLHLASGNGFEVLERVKSSLTPPQVIVLTGFPFAPYRDKCAALGADFFFDKANEFDRVAETMLQLASRRANKPAQTADQKTAPNNQNPPMVKAKEGI